MSAADKAGPGNRGVSRVLKKLESSVNSQNWFVEIYNFFFQKTYLNIFFLGMRLIKCTEQFTSVTCHKKTLLNY